MKLEQILNIIPYDEHIYIDVYVSTKEGYRYVELFDGRKMDFVSYNFKNYKVQMISTLPSNTGTTLYINIK